jgi:hypothetical protein
VKRATDDFRLLNGLLESRQTFSRRKNPAALTRSSVVDRWGVAVRPGDSENLAQEATAPIKTAQTANPITKRE